MILEVPIIWVSFLDQLRPYELLSSHWRADLPRGSNFCSQPFYSKARIRTIPILIHFPWQFKWRFNLCLLGLIDTRTRTSLIDHRICNDWLVEIACISPLRSTFICSEGSLERWFKLLAIHYPIFISIGSGHWLRLFTSKACLLIVVHLHFILVYFILKECCMRPHRIWFRGYFGFCGFRTRSGCFLWGIFRWDVIILWSRFWRSSRSEGSSLPCKWAHRSNTRVRETTVPW